MEFGCLIEAGCVKLEPDQQISAAEREAGLASETRRTPKKMSSIHHETVPIGMLFSDSV